MKPLKDYFEKMGLQLFLRQEPTPSLSPEAHADLRAFLIRRRAYTDSWFFLLRVLLGLGVFGHLLVGMISRQEGISLDITLAGLYVLINLAIHIKSNHGFQYARWGYMILDFLSVLALRYEFKFDALLDPHATMIGLFSLLLIAYVQYSDVRLGSVLALVTILFTVLTLWIDLRDMLPIELPFFANLPTQYPHPLQALLLLSALAAVCVVTHRLVHRLYSQLLRYSIEQEQRSKAAVASALERSRRERLEELNQLKHNFITVISHELRNPITPLLTSLDILRDELGSAVESYEMLGIARESASRIQRIITDYTKLAELVTMDDENLLRWNLRLTDLMDVLKEQTDKEPRMIGAFQNLVVCTDPRLLGGALLALLRRAELHTPDSETITFCGYGNQDEVVMSIHDPASYLEEQTIAALDDPFVLSSERAFSQQPTTGLELILASHSMRRIGGTLEISSQPNVGTTVHCMVPGPRPNALWLDDTQLRHKLGTIGM
ncbi:MAG: sensor histidine kinase [Rhodothermales bacterium]